MARLVLAIDPGREKCGLALVRFLPSASPRTQILFRAIAPTAEIGLTCDYILQQYPDAEIIVGQGTGKRLVEEMLQKFLPHKSWRAVPEAYSSALARQRYFQEQPPLWWQRLLPQGLRLPPRPVDDYAAVILAEHYLCSLHEAATKENKELKQP